MKINCAEQKHAGCHEYNRNIMEMYCILYAQQDLGHTHTNPQNAQCKYHIRVFNAYNIDFQNRRQALMLATRDLG